MKSLILLFLSCIIATLPDNVVAGGPGSGRRKGYSSYSKRSFSAHGINGCGVPYCHGSKCKSTSFSTSSSSSSWSKADTFKTVNSANSTIRTASTVVRTIDSHRKTEKDLVYKDLRNEKLKRELENNRQMDRRVIIVRENPKNVLDTNESKPEVLDDSTTNKIHAIVLTIKPSENFATCLNCGWSIHCSRKECSHCHQKVKFVKAKS